jgi:hypothetical protein
MGHGAWGFWILDFGFWILDFGLRDISSCPRVSASPLPPCSSAPRSRLGYQNIVSLDKDFGILERNYIESPTE